MKFIAKTYFGLETVLAEELRALGASEVRTVSRAVVFEGDKAMLYRANLCLRTALRILQVLKVGTVGDAEDLYRMTQRIDWSEWLDGDQTFCVDGLSSGNPSFNNTMFVALKVKDAIVDQFRTKTGSRPSIDIQHPDVRINVHILRNECTWSLDSSGESLHKRGYRSDRHPAPLSEVLAAGMLLLAGWDGQKTFLDPMCGSGTLPIEAAMIALQMAPNLQRRVFGFQTWRSYDPKLWQTIRAEAEAKTLTDLDCRIIGSDISPSAAAMTRENVTNAGLDDFIRIGSKPFAEQKPPTEHGLLMTNPPYGERIYVEDLLSLYHQLGIYLKENYQGWESWLLSGNAEAVAELGLTASKSIMLYNGKIECRLLRVF